MNLFNLAFFKAINGDGSGGGSSSAEIHITKSIQGTLARPFGDESFSALADRLASKEAFATIAFSFSGTPVTIRLDANSTSVWGNTCSIGSSVNDTTAVSVSWNEQYGLAYTIKALMNGAVSDMSSYATGIETTYTEYGV